ncbi:MAG TPA: DM13 domain-containing protein [Acidimicrobiales bacterium]|nr:DM13 domain-containing protein [Acidimicrobiales bacterium]
MTDTLIRPPVPSEPPPPPSPWRPGPVLAVIGVLVAALLGGNFLGWRDRFIGAPTAAPVAVASGRQATDGGATATSAAPSGATAKSVLRSNPWWQGVTTLQGTGSTTTAPVAIDPSALQFRATWTCQTGHLTVASNSRPRPFVDSSCPSNNVGYGVDKGSVTLKVTADGPWTIKIDQQIDVPLYEPPLPAMTSPGASVVAKGDFYRVDQVGQGTVTIYRLPSGTYALRLDDFFVTPNSDLEIRLSPLDAPKSTDQFANGPQSALVKSLDVTAGALNFDIPPEVNVRQYHSVVLWCEVQHSAYAAASLS